MSAFLCQGIRNAGCAVKGIRHFLKGCVRVGEKEAVPGLERMHFQNSPCGNVA